MEIPAVNLYADRHSGVVVVEDDVQNIVREIREISPRLRVYYEESRERVRRAPFVIVEHCLDGVERKVTEAWVLDKQLVNRVRLADHWHGKDVPEHILSDDQDVAAKQERENDAIQARLDEEARVQIEDAAEQMHYALRRMEHGHSVTPGMPHVGSKRNKKRSD